MKWAVTEKTGLHKRIRKLPEKVQDLLIALKKRYGSKRTCPGRLAEFQRPIRRSLSLPFEKRPSDIRGDLGS